MFYKRERWINLGRPGLVSQLGRFSTIDNFYNTKYKIEHTKLFLQNLSGLRLNQILDQICLITKTIHFVAAGKCLWSGKVLSTPTFGLKSARTKSSIPRLEAVRINWHFL